MEKIPAKDRFNQNAVSASIPDDLLYEALKQFGLNPKKCELKRFTGGFMNANFQVSSACGKIVLRVYASDSSVAQKEFDLLRFL
jgi:hypothetical protein